MMMAIKTTMMAIKTTMMVIKTRTKSGDVKIPQYEKNDRFTISILVQVRQVAKGKNMADRALINAGVKFMDRIGKGAGFIIVVSADKDTVPLLDSARENGIGSLVVFRGGASLKLLRAPDVWFDVDKRVLMANTKRGQVMKRAVMDGVEKFSGFHKAQKNRCQGRDCEMPSIPEKVVSQAAGPFFR